MIKVTKESYGLLALTQTCPSSLLVFEEVLTSQVLGARVAKWKRGLLHKEAVGRVSSCQTDLSGLRTDASFFHSHYVGGVSFPVRLRTNPIQDFLSRSSSRIKNK
jgi:hypothetical protein